MPKKIILEERIFACLSNNNLSYIMVAIANFFWVSGFVFGNQHNFSFVENQLSRYLMQALITYGISKKMGYHMQFKSVLQFNILFVRSFILTIHSFILCWSQLYLPLYVVHTITAFGPIFVCLLNYLIYGKAINRDQITGIIVAFGGIMLTVNGRQLMPYIDSEYVFQSDFKNYKSDNPLVLLFVSGILFILVVFWAYAILITKKNEHHIVEVVYHQAIFGIIGTSFGYMFLEERVSFGLFSQSLMYIGLVLGGGFTIFNIGVSLSQNTGVCSVITQMTVIIGYGFSVFRYGEKLNIICAMGTIMLTIGVILVIFKKDPIKKKQQMSKMLNQNDIYILYKKKNIFFS